MVYVFLIVSTLVLFGSFLALTRHETARGVRMAAAKRARLDAFATRAAFVVEHVDFQAFFREEFRRGLGWGSHAAANVSLQIVRLAERLLTRVVRKLRLQHQIEPRSADTTREFVKTLSDFKGRLKETVPEMAATQKQS